MEIIKEPKLMQARAGEIRAMGKKIAFVPTMGALHEGHIRLVDIAKCHGEVVVMSIYVNPRQFDSKEDLGNYPSVIERDLEMAGAGGVDIIFCPEDRAMYPDGFETYVETEDISRGLCGASRPGHFRGVATVVLKLFNIVKPDVAVFGEKDYQQLKVIERMVADLNIGVEIVSAPIVRESDGLAMSSRNAYLGPNERGLACSINEALRHAADAVKKGERDIEKIIAEVEEHIKATGVGRVDYVKICDLETLREMKEIKTPALIAVAAYFGKARLIDNCVVD